MSGFLNVSKQAITAVFIGGVFLFSILVQQAVCEDERCLLLKKRQKWIEEKACSKRPSISLSAACEILSAEQKVILAKQIQGLLYVYLSPDLVNPKIIQKINSNRALSGLSDFDLSVLKETLVLAKANQPSEYLAALKTIDLDRLCPMTPTVFSLAHKYALNQSIPGTETIRSRQREIDRLYSQSWENEIVNSPGYILPDDTPLTQFKFYKESDELPVELIPQSSVAPGPYGFWYKGATLIDIPDYVQVNSALFARALNELTNCYNQNVNIEFATGKRVFNLKKPADLIDALYCNRDLSLSLHSAHMFNDYLHYLVKHGETMMSVKMGSYMAASISPDDPMAYNDNVENPFMMPAGHGEQIIAIWQKGSTKPVAMVRWYMGVSSGPKVQGLRFKPLSHQKSSWVGYRVVYNYSGRGILKRMVTAAGRFQQYINFLQNRYKFPIWGYTVTSVCNDSAALMETVLRPLNFRKSGIWGTVSDKGYEFYLAPLLEETGLKMIKAPNGWDVLNVPSDTYIHLTPKYTKRNSLLYRLGKSIPSTNPAEIHYSDVKEAVKLLRDNSIIFKSALRR